MSTCDESDTAMDGTPPNLKEEAKLAMENLLPAKSKERYMNTNQTFMQWRDGNRAKSFSETLRMISITVGGATPAEITPPKVPLDIPQPQQINKLNYQLVLNAQKPVPGTIPLPVINLLQTMPNKQVIRTITPNNSNIPIIRKNLTQTSTQELTKNAMSPLSLNIGSPMYSLPSSPNTYSPAMSPAQQVLSPYSTPQSLSPVRYRSSGSRLVSPAGIIQGSDPYLTNKMQASPPFPIHTNDFLDSNVSITSPDFWTEPELQGTNDLLTAFDDVKLV